MAIFAINTDTLGISAYCGALFDRARSPVLAGGMTLVLEAAGLFEQSAGDDDGEAISAYVETGALGFGDVEREKFCPETRMYARAPRGASLVTVTRRAGDVLEREYSVASMAGEAARGRRVKLGRGVRGVAWGFRVGNSNGGELSLRGLAVALMASKATR